MDLDFGRSIDRISKLPDSVLCHILSFLPTKYAVGTSILSTRWQYLWTSVAMLDFNDSELFNKRDRTNGIGEAEVDLRFTNFVNTVLLLSDVSCLEKFNLKLESLCYFGIVKAWISNAIKRNVQKLELCYSARHNFDGQIPIHLPHMLFICKTMVDLRLNGNISLKVPASVWLPSLKILEIKEVIYENGDSAHNLIHGCPALEDLHIFMFYFDKQKVLNISVPTLKRLVLTRLGDDGHLFFSEHKLTVNTPKLEYLVIADDVAVEFSLENLSSLLDACINVGPCFSGSISSSNLLKLLRGIANVKFLRFSSANSDDYVLPIINPLHNLTYLELQNVSDGWNKDLLNVFLEYSPNLEVLVLEGSIARQDRPWSPPPRVPSCLLLNLKEIKCCSCTGGELNVSVPTLRRLTITRFGDGIHDHLTKLVVNAPKLEHIHLSDYVTRVFLLENLSSLLRACLVIGGDCLSPLIHWPNRLTIYDGCISMLLMGIANVKSLDFFSELSDYCLPTFPNLTHLRLGGRNGGWNLKLLNEFLECSPNLQVLTLEENRVPGSTKCWTPPTRVPCCLLSHLEEIRILKFDGDGYDLGVLVYLLENAQVLKKLTIDCQNSTRASVLYPSLWFMYYVYRYVVVRFTCLL
ncbi:hypothetical protein RHGRI_018562 [Rhododendron griersonianum]|uniref:F-box domain-containing protein n=1 Tax=Rhododendron griersonianum TaxID=479676 RepID=A0AAV6K1Z9_9ERIC|nr:hypothetical protein RHGRI_018562 [Rhododendron griersonianum]